MHYIIHVIKYISMSYPQPCLSNPYSLQTWTYSSTHMSQIPTLEYLESLRDKINNFIIDEGQGLSVADVTCLRVS